MKKYLKIDFTKRDTRSAICLIAVLVLVLVLGSSFGYVSAEENLETATCTLNLSDYENSSFYDSDASYVKLFTSPDNPGKSLYAYIENDDLDFSNINGLNGSSIKYYFFASYQASAFYVYLFTGNTYFCSKTGYTSFFTDGDMYRVSLNYVAFSQDGHYGMTYAVDNTSLISIPNSNGTYGNFRRIDLTLDQTVRYTNMPLYTALDGWDSNNNYIDQFDAFYSSVIQGNLDSSFTNYNYFIDDIYSLNGFPNLENIHTGGEDGETSLNNLYLNNPFWVFNMPSYSTSNRGNIVKNNGTASFNASMTNYQLEHSSEFNLHFTFQITVKYTADGGFTGGSHGFYLLGSTPFCALGSETVSRTGTFKYRPSGNDTYSTLSLEHFTGSYTFNTITNYRYIFANCYLDGDRTKDDFLTWFTRNYSSDEVQFSSIVLKSTAELFDSYMNYSSPCIYQYDFVSGTSSMLSDGMGTNNNPYDYQNQDSYSDSVNGAYGYVTQNNNQSVTITNSNVNSNDISNVIGDIGDEQDSDSLINKFSSLLSLSSWVAVFASAMGFVPVAFWTNLVEYFAVALGILSTFLVLRYILNLLT